jgi:large subunit ribosomal protein L18
MKLKTKSDYRRRRHKRVRRKVQGTAERPRMAVFRSNRYLYVQLIDDTAGVTLLGLSSRQAGVPCTVEGARELGRRLAAGAEEKGIRRMVVDRGGFRFHGRLRALVEAACEAGLKDGADRETATAGQKEEQ